MICFVFATEEGPFGAEMSCFSEQVYHLIYAQEYFPLFQLGTRLEAGVEPSPWKGGGERGGGRHKMFPYPYYTLSLWL